MHTTVELLNCSTVLLHHISVRTVHHVSTVFDGCVSEGIAPVLPSLTTVQYPLPLLTKLGYDRLAVLLPNWRGVL